MKYLRVAMPDGSLWYVPCEVIATNRANYYQNRIADKYKSTTGFKEEFDYTMNRNPELLDWAVNNMNWEDVKDSAVKVDETPPLVDFQEGWVNGDKDIVEKP